MNYHTLPRIIFGFYCLSVLYSCEFESKEEYFVEIQPPVSRSAIDLSTVTDSIYIWDFTELIYSFKANGHNLYQMNVFVDNKQLTGYFGETGTIKIDPSDYSTGKHILRFNYHTSTGSNSLADHFRAESFEVNKEYTVYIDNVPPDAPVFKSVYVKNGTMMIEWNKPNKFNFKKLTLRARYEGNITRTETLKIDTTLFNDQDYIGGKVDYELEIEGYKYVLKSNKATFDTSVFSINAEVLDQKHIQFSWEKPALYSNIGYITITLEGFEIMEHVISNMEKGSAILSYDFHFGEQLPYSFSIQRKYNWSTEFSNYPYLFFGRKVPPCFNTKTAYNKTSNAYFTIGKNQPEVTKDNISTNYYLYKIDRDNLNILGYKLLGNGFDQYRNQLSINNPTTGSLLYKNELIKFNISDLSFIERIDLADYTDSPEVTYFKVAQNNFLFLSTLNGTEIIDLTNKHVIQHISVTMVNEFTGSDDGKFFYNNGIFYSVSSDYIVNEVMVIDNQQTNTFFMTNQPGLCIVEDYGMSEIRIYNLNDQTYSTVFSDPSVNGSKMFYDLYQPDYIGLKSDMKFFLINYKTGKFQTMDIIDDFGEDIFYYSGGRLFSTIGVCYDYKF